MGFSRRDNRGNAQGEVKCGLFRGGMDDTSLVFLTSMQSK